MALSNDPNARLGLKDIVTEFGGSGNHGLSEYYGAAAGVPTSARLGLRDFIGKAGVIEVTYTQADFNAGNATALGVVNTKAFFEFKLGIQLSEVNTYIFNNTASSALTRVDVAGFPDGSLIQIKNYGTIRAKGGRGGILINPTKGTPDAGNGSPGLPAILASMDIEIYNHGSIYRGGGGGAAGGHIWAQNNKNGGSTYYYGIAGGGGGGGYGNAGDNSIKDPSSANYNVTNPTAGSLTGGGARGRIVYANTNRYGGAGGSYNAVGASATSYKLGTNYTKVGGAVGVWAQANFYASQNRNAVITWKVTGNRY